MYLRNKEYQPPHVHAITQDFDAPFLIENTKQAIVFFFSGIEEYGVVPIISIMALIGFSLYILKMDLN